MRQQFSFFCCVDFRQPQIFTHFVVAYCCVAFGVYHRTGSLRIVRVAAATAVDSTAVAAAYDILYAYHTSILMFQS